MKNIVLLFLFVSTLSFKTNADTMMDYVSRYAIPCVTGLAIGAAIDSQNGLKFGAVACSVTIAFGENTLQSKNNLTDADLKAINQMMSDYEKNLMESFSSHVDEKVSKVREEVKTEGDKSRILIRGTVTDMAIILEDEINKKIEKKLSDGDFTPGLEKRLNKKIREDVVNEVKLREKDIVESAAQSVIERVTAEPVEVPNRQNKSKAKKTQSPEEDEEEDSEEE